MDMPASYYGELDKRNPVIISIERDVSSFMTLMRRVGSSDHSSYVKGIQILVEIRKKYKHRLPSKLYGERMLQIADFLYGIKLYQLALWQGYSLLLLQFNSAKITDITDVDHFMACFFPEGFDTDQDIFAMKVRAMQGCAMCIFEQEKRHSVLSQKGLCKLLHVLNFLRIMMQAFQQHEHLCWQIYNGPEFTPPLLASASCDPDSYGKWTDGLFLTDAAASSTEQTELDRSQTQKWPNLSKLTKCSGRYVQF